MGWEEYGSQTKRKWCAAIIIPRGTDDTIGTNWAGTFPNVPPFCASLWIRQSIPRHNPLQGSDSPSYPVTRRKMKDVSRSGKSVNSETVQEDHLQVSKTFTELERTLWGRGWPQSPVHSNTLCRQLRSTNKEHVDTKHSLLLSLYIVKASGKTLEDTTVNTTAKTGRLQPFHRWTTIPRTS